jgi:hypothetical protein
MDMLKKIMDGGAIVLTLAKGVARRSLGHWLCGAAGVLLVAGAQANGYGESGSWNFQTSQDRVNKAVVTDMIEKKKNGYYNAIKSTYNYNTYIDKQVNCTLSSVTTGTSGSNGLQASASSPVLNNTGTTSASGAANTASNGLSQSSLTGVFNTNTSPPGSISSGQSSSGALNSSISASSNSASTGEVVANGGTTDQVLNSQQSNSGILTSSISASSACAGSLP